MKTLLATLLVVIGLLAGMSPSRAAPKASDLVQADLVVEPRLVTPGEPFWVGVRLRMREHWHTYWRNPGDSGLPSEVTWTVPDGMSVGPLQWPTPERIEISQLVNYGYEGEVMLMARVSPAASLQPGRPAEIKANVSYLVCERECIPGEASLATTLPVGPPGQGIVADEGNRAVFAATRARLPVATTWRSSVRSEGDDILIRIETADVRPDAIRSSYFFPFHETAIDFEAPQTLSADGGALLLKLRRGPMASAVPGDLGGVLVVEDTSGAKRSYEFGQPPAAVAAAAGGLATPALPAPARLTLVDILQAAAFAFLGGLVLNLMPCVFPVLSIKVLSLVRHAGHTPGLVRLNGLAYAAGVVLSFVFLAGLLIAIRAGGAEIGWGFQLQSPAFVTGLAFLLMAMGLSLSGAVEFGASLGGVGGGLATRSGLSGSFFTGILATVVATPCTAPFMGAAVGYALTAPAGVALAIFVALGCGLALPFVLLCFVPALVRRIPRPGRWMEILKQILAFPIYATVAWLIFVLSQEVGPSGLFAALIGLVIVGAAVWAWRFAATAEGWGRGLAAGTVLACLAALVGVGVSVDRDRAVSTTLAAGDSGIEPFTQARLDALQAEGRPVFVNMTAAWCITCIVNERMTLSSETVREAFRSRRIAYLKGDWTNQNPEITRLLERHGRSGVPLYLLYAGGGEAVVLPQILTQAIVIESFGQIAGSKRADAGRTIQER